MFVNEANTYTFIPKYFLDEQSQQDALLILKRLWETGLVKSWYIYP